MAEKGPPAPTPKLKKKFPVTGQTTKKGNNLNPKVVIKPYRSKSRTECIKSTKSTSQFA